MWLFFFTIFFFFCTIVCYIKIHVKENLVSIQKYICICNKDLFKLSNLIEDSFHCKTNTWKYLGCLVATESGTMVFTFL